MWKCKEVYLSLLSDSTNCCISDDKFIELRSFHLKKFNQLLKVLEESKTKTQIQVEFSLDSNDFDFSTVIV